MTDDWMVNTHVFDVPADPIEDLLRYMHEITGPLYPWQERFVEEALYGSSYFVVHPPRRSGMSQTERAARSYEKYRSKPEPRRVHMIFDEIADWTHPADLAEALEPSEVFSWLDACVQTAAARGASAPPWVAPREYMVSLDPSGTPGTDPGLMYWSW